MYVNEEEFKRYYDRYYKGENSEDVVKYFKNIFDNDEPSYNLIMACNVLGHISHRCKLYQYAYSYFDKILAYEGKSFALPSMVANAYYMIGVMYEHGEYVQKSMEKAIFAYRCSRKVKENKYAADACRRLGI